MRRLQGGRDASQAVAAAAPWACMGRHARWPSPAPASQDPWRSRNHATPAVPSSRSTLQAARAVRQRHAQPGDGRHLRHRHFQRPYQLARGGEISLFGGLQQRSTMGRSVRPQRQRPSHGRWVECMGRHTSRAIRPTHVPPSRRRTCGCCCWGGACSSLSAWPLRAACGSGTHCGSTCTGAAPGLASQSSMLRGAAGCPALPGRPALGPAACMQPEPLQPLQPCRLGKLHRRPLPAAGRSSA